MAVALDTLNRITADVLGNVSVADSRLTYTAEMLRARKDIEDDVAATPAGVVIDLPSDLPDLDLPDATIDQIAAFRSARSRG